jgi:hypothetical protein
MSPALARAQAFLRQNGANLATELLVNFAGPFIIYSLAKKDLGDVGALIASSAPPMVWTLIEFARHRRIDAVSILVLGGMVLSLLAMLGGGGVRFLQLRERLVTAVIGGVFLGSALIGKPLIYQLARANLQRRGSGELEGFEALSGNVHFRRVMTVMTAVWGVGLLIDAGISAVLVFALSIPAFMVASHIVGYATMGSLGLWTWWYARRARAKGAARQAAQAAQAAEAARLQGANETPPLTE